MENFLRVFNNIGCHCYFLYRLWNKFKFTKYQKKIFRKFYFKKRKKYFWGPTEIWTRIAGFKVQSANHYTMGPCVTCDFASMVYKSGTQGQQKTLFTWRWEWYCTFLRLCKRQLLWMIHSCISSYNSCVKFDESGPEFFKNFIVPLKTC